MPLIPPQLLQQLIQMSHKTATWFLGIFRRTCASFLITLHNKSQRERRVKAVLTRWTTGGGETSSWLRPEAESSLIGRRHWWHWHCWHWLVFFSSPTGRKKSSNRVDYTSTPASLDPEYARQTATRVPPHGQLVWQPRRRSWGGGGSGGAADAASDEELLEVEYLLLALDFGEILLLFAPFGPLQAALLQVFEAGGHSGALRRPRRVTAVLWRPGDTQGLSANW